METRLMVKPDEFRALVDYYMGVGPNVEDIVFFIRKDPKKYARVKDLLTMNEELKKARKAFDAESYGEMV